MVWRKQVTKMASEYPEVDVTHLLIDTAAMDLIRHPQQVFLASPLGLKTSEMNFPKLDYYY